MMTELESDKDFMISRWVDSVAARTYKIKPEIQNEMSMSYRAGYISAVSDFKDFLVSMGIYRK